MAAETAERQGTALAKSEDNTAAVAIRGLYADTTSLMQAFGVAAKMANLLLPVTRIDFIPPGYSVSLRIVQLDPLAPDPKGQTERARMGGGDVYKPEQGGDGFAISKVALDKLSAAAGISWDPRLCTRMDDGSDAHYVEFRAAGHLIDFDGRRRDICATKAVDLRKGSATIAGWTDRRLQIAREHILSLSESKAKNRAIRQALTIKAKYTAEELRRHFVVPTLVFDPNRIEDPEMRREAVRRITDRALGMTDRLYGPKPVEPIDVTPKPEPKSPPPPVSETKADNDDGEPTDAQIEAGRVAFERRERERLERAGQTTIPGTGPRRTPEEPPPPTDDGIPY